MGSIYTNKKVKEIGVTGVQGGTGVTAGVFECRECQLASSVEVDEFVDIELAKRMRKMGKRVWFDGDRFEVKGKWLRVYWDQRVCSVDGQPCLPDGVMHRCPHTKAIERKVAKGSEQPQGWWEQ